MKLIDVMQVIRIRNGFLGYSIELSTMRRNAIYVNPKFVTKLVVNNKRIIKNIGKMNINKYACILTFKKCAISELLTCDLFFLNEQIDNELTNIGDIFSKEDHFIWKLHHNINIDIRVIKYCCAVSCSFTYMLKRIEIRNSQGIEINKIKYNIVIDKIVIMFNIYDKQIDTKDWTIVFHYDS
jgi:hypothetical protein